MFYFETNMASCLMSSGEEDNTQVMFGPLSFRNGNDSNWNGDDYETDCLLCDDRFNLDLSLHIFVKHIFEVHHLVIEDVQNIFNLPGYISYWKDRFNKVAFESTVPSLNLDATSGKYYLMSTLMKEDKEIRHKLRLEQILRIQESERTNTDYRKDCLFCRLAFEGTRQDFLKHLSEQHNLQLGNPQNLVHIEELVSHIEAKLKALECIYCEKVFPERTILKEHMRKKLHKRINPKNKCYDKYYIVNYLEMGKDWHVIQREDDRLPIVNDANSDEEYSDWNEKADEITCLFCPTKEPDMPRILQHMLANHGFDFQFYVSDLDFYQRIKLINYIRRQIHGFNCIFCERHCGDRRLLQDHMQNEDHCKIPDLKVFDQPLYYFPTYENDAFLYLIDDTED